MKTVPTVAGDYITRAIMRTEDITFLPRIQLDRHPRYKEFHRLIGVRDFAAYREVFERGWAETSIMCGELVRLDHLPITDTLPPSTLLVNLMGINEHSPKRVRLVEEFIGCYERMGRSRFLKANAFRTEYARDLMAAVGDRMAQAGGLRQVIAGWRIKRRVRKRIMSFLNVYENMKRFGTLVAGAQTLQETQLPLQAGDIPWAIDYHGYIKLREGAHRRAVARYLGWDTIPTLVFEFGRVTRVTLKNAHPYLRYNFEWFETVVRKVAALELERRPGQSL